MGLEKGDFICELLKLVQEITIDLWAPNRANLISIHLRMYHGLISYSSADPVVIVRVVVD